MSQHSAPAKGGDRGPAGEGLHGRDPEVLLARLDAGGASPVELPESLRRQAGLHVHVGAVRQRFEPDPLGPRADEHEASSEPARRGDRGLETLVGHEGADGEQEVPRGASGAGGVKNVHVDRRVAHRRFAAVVAAMRAATADEFAR